MDQAVSCGFSLWMLGFALRTIHVGFVVDKVAMGQAFLLVLWFYPVNIIAQWLSTHASPGR
jgi:hypothetical protein